ncbi:MAG: aminoglycoside phosphotransferase family protein [Chitinispirillia bacterium]|nr:aminoglycoside phosphotransferase family protein [Chitinispirillia bacterium]
MIPQEVQTIEKLLDSNHEIVFSDAGHTSRAYVIDDGRIVFKFPRSPEVSYDTEIKVLNAINTLTTDIGLQRVGWTTQNSSYLGLYGVIGTAIKNIELSSAQKLNIGNCIGCFLRELHNLEVSGVPVVPLVDEIKTWHERYLPHKDFIDANMTAIESARLHELMMEEAPSILIKLGDDRVFAHGDLTGNNIFLDKSGKVGLIDFSESGYYDRAIDFMDIGDREISEAMLEAYGADDKLVQKISIRQRIRPAAILIYYRQKDDYAGSMRTVEKIRASLKNI